MKLNYLFNQIYYHPKVIGKHNIPKTGKIVLCGNHLDERDSIILSSVIKRKINWIDSSNIQEQTNNAIEYLKQGDTVGLFPEGTINTYRLVQLEIMKIEKQMLIAYNDRKLRSSDCMTKIYYLNEQLEQLLQELQKAKEELSVKGFDVIDYDVLLPFNKMAVNIFKETGAQILPFAITGNYGFINNPIVRIGKPLMCDNIEEVRERVKQLIYTNNKKI